MYVKVKSMSSLYNCDALGQNLANSESRLILGLLQEAMFAPLNDQLQVDSK